MKSVVLTAALVAGGAASAYAQSIAALPPGDNQAPPAATAPLGPSVTEQAFPNGPRDLWNGTARMQAAAPFLGPAPSSDRDDNSDQ
ncbi:MAG TPA: hypothetical protein VJR70_02845 [Stellaceae bacterium]|nr:hypothetical protein [Stellaceae bacterium]